MRLRKISLMQIAAFLFSCTLVFPAITLGQFYDLEVNCSSDSLLPNGLDYELPIYMSNFSDSVVGFQMVFSSSHPSILTFSNELVTEGTLVENWELVATNYSGNFMKISALADMPDHIITKGIGYPQNGQVPLVKIKCRLGQLPDSMTTDYIDIFISDIIQDFIFSDENGDVIGIAYNPPTLDTHYYNCTDWAVGTPGDSLCLNWEEVPGPIADSIEVDSILNPYLDTTVAMIVNGRVYPIIVTICGDVNGDENVNLLDVTYYINWLYNSGPIPASLSMADVDNSGFTNILDVSYLIGYLYLGGPEPSCPE